MLYITPFPLHKPNFNKIKNLVLNIMFKDNLGAHKSSCLFQFPM